MRRRRRAVNGTVPTLIARGRALSGVLAYPCPRTLSVSIDVPDFAMVFEDTYLGGRMCAAMTVTIVGTFEFIGARTGRRLPRDQDPDENRACDLTLLSHWQLRDDQVDCRSEANYGLIETRHAEVSFTRNHRFEFFRPRWHRTCVCIEGKRGRYKCDPTEISKFRFLVKKTRLSCVQVETPKLSSSASTWKPPLEMPSKHSLLKQKLPKSHLQREAKNGRTRRVAVLFASSWVCLLYTSPSPRDS